ncbi:MAG TPA: glycosyltransferase family 4 protein [Candidatus Woesearchaeota archaeon]|nr:glycosyltransferase family 4 protein [Candidatus Woesearchaeota archaeon]
MKITFIDDEPEIYPHKYGGKAFMIVSTAEELAKIHNIEVSIVSQSIKSSLDNFYLNDVLYKVATGYTTVSTLLSEIKNSDVYNVHMCSFGMPLVPNKHDKLSVYHLHDIMFSTADIGSHLDKILSYNYDYVVAPSEFAASVLRNVAPWKEWNNLHVIPRGLHPKLLSNNLNLNDNERARFEQYYPIIFFPNRPIFYKGFNFLVDLIEPLKKKYANPLIITTGEKCDSNIMGVGWLEKERMSLIYKLADVVFIPTLLPESFSQVCIESIALKTNVVTFKTGNIQNLAEEFSSIITVEPNINSIIKGIIYSIDRPFCDSDKKKVIEKYSITNVINKLLELYKTPPPENREISFSQGYFTRPDIIYGEDTVYTIIRNKIQRHFISVDQYAVLKFCQKYKSDEEINVLDQTIKKNLQSLVDENLIVRIRL